ncbi:MAG: hypothetical protein WHT84_06400 [Breznakiellaceae bacterium]
MEPSLVLPWFSSSAPQDVVLYSRISIRRNLEGFPFPSRLPEVERNPLREKLKAAIAQVDSSFRPVESDTQNVFPGKDTGGLTLLSSPAVRELYPLFPFSVPEDEGACIWRPTGNLYYLGGEDHLQALFTRGGLSFRPLWKDLVQIDEALDKTLQWACHEEFGFLTSDVSICGAAMTLEALVFIPAILAKELFERISGNLVSKGIELVFLDTAWGRGEQGGSENAEDHLPLVNLRFAVPAGMSEEEALAFFEEHLEKVVLTERKARHYHLEEEMEELQDGVVKALAVLRAALLLDEEEARFMLAQVRMGLAYGILSQEKNVPSYGALDTLWFTLGPQMINLEIRDVLAEAGKKENPKKVRALLVRRALP